jgi:hypothetical protein
MVHGGGFETINFKMCTTHSVAGRLGLSPGLGLSTLSGVGAQGWPHRLAAKPTLLLGLCIIPPRP